MPLSVAQFIRRYQASGLADATPELSIKRLAETFASKTNAKLPDSGNQDGATVFAKWLVKNGRLTKFQAQQILASDSPILKIGDFVLQQKISSGPFAGFFLASQTSNTQRSDSDLPDNDARTPMVVLKRLRQPLSKNQTARLLRFQEISSPNLMQIDWPFPSPIGDFVVGKLPAGKPASSIIANTPLGPKQASLVASDLITALETLHQTGMMAVPVHIDQVWLNKDETAVLIVDPLAGNASADSSLLAINELDHDQPPQDKPAQDAIDQAAQYRAPELFLDNAAPDQSSDLYAIGCLLYQLHFGEPPFPGLNAKRLQDAHSKVTPARLDNPDPKTAKASTSHKSPTADNAFRRVLVHLLAKNRDSRFATATDANRALMAAIASLPADAPRPTENQQPKSIPAQPQTPTPTPTTKTKADARPTQVSQPITAAQPQPVSQPQTVPQPVSQPVPQPTSAPAPTPAPKPAPTPSLTPEPSAESTPKKTASVSNRPSQSPTKNPAKSPTESSAKKRVPVRRKKKKSLVGPIVLGGLGFVLMVLIVLILIRGNGSAPVAKTPESQPLPKPPTTFKGSSTNSPADANTANDSDQQQSSYQLVDDDRILWASPEPSPSPELTMLPPGSPMIVTFRPDALDPNGPAKQLFAAFTPELTAAWKQLENRVGVPLADVERVAIAVRPAGEGQVTGALAVYLKAPASITLLTEKWQADAAQTPDGATIYLGSESTSDAYYFGPVTEDSQTGNPQAGKTASRYAIGDIDAIKEVAEFQGASIPLPPNLTDLWKGVGGNPEFALLTTTNFLFADGRSMLETYASQLSDPLRDRLIPDASGLAIRMDFSPQWFGELRLSPGGGLSPAVLKKDLEDQLAKLPEIAEQFLLGTSPHPSWRALAIRLPQMMRAFSAATRTGVVDGNVVANFYLPPNAAPNILLATMLAANTPPGANNSTAQPSTANAPQPLKTIEQLLDARFSVEFTQESLEMASQTVEDQFNSITPKGSLPLDVILIGSDLQLEGITQNQQIRNFAHTGSTLRQVLDDLVRRANPDQTATELNQEAQKLIWVVAPDPSDPGKQAVFITVRSQAKKKNYPLPDQFAPK